MKSSSDPVAMAPSPTGPLDERSLHLRRLVMRALVAADKGHVGSALSLIEIFRVLYDDIVRHDPARPRWPDRDRVILSKGHGCLALYVLLADKGYFPVATLDKFCKRDSPLGGHPERELDLGIEASTGALGHGLPFAVGKAVALRREGSGARVFVIVGDGELNEGSNWEALLMAAKHRLDHLIVLVDHNAQQLNGPLEQVMPMAPLLDKFEAFGADSVETDGHSPKQLLEALNAAIGRNSGRPQVIVCHTIKGKGLSFAEQNPQWHYRRSFDEKLIQQMTEQWAHRP